MQLLAIIGFLLCILQYYSSVSAQSSPLLLTPYIQQGKIKQGQKAASVNLKKFGIKNLRSYSGFLTVDERYDSNLFFWYFPAQKSPSKAPLVLWLQGGPGNSSLFGLFEINGPIYVKPSNKLAKRKITWNTNYSLLYIDNPVGAGFSYTNGGYCQNQTIIGQQLYKALLQFFVLFPDVKGRDFYLTGGESYAGKYIPAIAYTILKNNDNSSTKINLKGLAIGNGFSSPINMIWKSELLYNLGFVDLYGRQALETYEHQIHNYIENEEWYNIALFYEMIFNDKDSVFINITGYNYYYNYLKTKPDHNYYRAFVIDNKNFRKGIHAANGTFENPLVSYNLIIDSMQSVEKWVDELLEYYPITFYNGLMDLLVTHNNTDQFLSKLNYSIKNGYSSVAQKKWYVGGDLAGYYKQVGNLSYVSIRNAGHIAPSDQPEWALDLITKFISNTTLSSS